MEKLAENIRKISVVIDQKDFNKIKRLAKTNKKTLSQYIRESLSFSVKNGLKSGKKIKKK